MAWTRDGRAFLYYLGGRNEVRFCRIDVTPGSDYALIGSTEYAAAFVKWSDYTRKSAAKG